MTFDSDGTVNQIMMKRSILTTAILAIGTAVMGATSAHAGIHDGALNNLHLIDRVSLLDTNINSDVQTVENTNANTRADG